MRSPQIILHGLISIAAACLNIAFSSNDVKAQYQGENERVWAASLQADISNGAAADDICRNASSSAVTSDDVNFKNCLFSCQTIFWKWLWNWGWTSRSTCTWEFVHRLTRMSSDGVTNERCWARYQDDCAGESMTYELSLILYPWLSWTPSRDQNLSTCCPFLQYWVVRWVFTLACQHLCSIR